MAQFAEYQHSQYFTSPHEVDVPLDVPVVFLAGPVQGAPNYQDRFARHILEQRPDVAVASPRRTVEDQALFDADEQVRWEIESRERAFMFHMGVTGIWLAAQEDDPTYPAGRAYAQTTRIELGETVGRYVASGGVVRFEVGIDPAYTGGSEGYIRRLMAYYGLSVSSSEDEFLERLVARID